MKIDATGDTSRDVHSFSDPTQLGAQLPADMLMDGPLLTGVVSETVDGERRPLRDVTVELDALGGMGVVAARTLTDAAGRYVLCGLSGEASTYMFASKPGYKLAEVGMVTLAGDTAVDIHLAR